MGRNTDGAGVKRASMGRNTDGAGVERTSGSPDTVFCELGRNAVPESLSLPPAALSQAKWYSVAAAAVLAFAAGMCGMLCLLVTSKVMMMSEIGLKEKLGGIPWSVGVAGFVAQIVDGSLGMGYGLTSSTILVSSGVASSTASTVVHLAQLGTTLVSGVAHYREGNIDHSTLRRISPLGGLGAFLGATALSSLPHSAAKPISGALLFLVGAYLLYRNGRRCRERLHAAPPSLAFLAPLGFIGGFIDATGGGGWGPVATSGLLAHGGLPPHIVIGVVSLSEFFVTCACCLGFALCHLFGAISHTTAGDRIPVDLVMVLLGGGMLAAPVAPMLVKAMQPEKLGAVVGGFVCLTNARVLLRSVGAPDHLASAVYGCVGLVAFVASMRANSRTKAS